MTSSSFSLSPNDIVLSDPEALADRLAEFLRARLCPDDADRDLLLMFVDRLFLVFCDDLTDEELKRGAHIDFEPLNETQIASLRRMQARALHLKPSEPNPSARAASPNH
jgi:hypothetical protein